MRIVKMVIVVSASDGVLEAIKKLHPLYHWLERDQCASTTHYGFPLLEVGEGEAHILADAYNTALMLSPEYNNFTPDELLEEDGSEAEIGGRTEYVKLILDLLDGHTFDEATMEIPKLGIRVELEKCYDLNSYSLDELLS